MRGSLLVLLTAGTLAAAACGGGRLQSGEGFGDITVFAASSLTEPFRDIGRLLESRRPGTRVTFNFASSSDLSVQITEGAPADVFASADRAQMRVVREAGLVAGWEPIATNRLVIVVPADNPADIHGYSDLARPGVKLVLAAPAVPAGAYARRVLDDLGLAERAEDNVVSNEEDVKAVVTKVALGEADAGIAYVTDVSGDARKAVEAIEFPGHAQVVAHYPIATLTTAPHPEGAKAFVELTTSLPGGRILRSHGFGPP